MLLQDVIQLLAALWTSDCEHVSINSSIILLVTNFQTRVTPRCLHRYLLWGFLATPLTAPHNFADSPRRNYTFGLAYWPLARLGKKERCKDVRIKLICYVEDELFIQAAGA